MSNNMKFNLIDGATAFEKAVDSLQQVTRLIVCGDPTEVDYLTDHMQHDTRSVEAIITQSADIAVPQWFEQRVAQFEQDYDTTEEEYMNAELMGEWPGEALQKPGLVLNTDVLSGKVLPKVLSTELKVEASWHIPAYFKLGGWNECPEAAIQCALWRYWQEKHGAHIVGVAHDVVEAYVQHPPSDRQSAMALAREHYLYCSDIVEQGTETIAQLASVLINHRVWYFWWD